jgi:VanZ family protein
VPVSPVTRRALAVAAVGLYWLLLFTLTHLPGRPGPLPLGHHISHLDKIGHVAAFTLLGLLSCAALSLFGKLSGHMLISVAIGLTIYAGLDEYTQSWVPGRTADPLDWLADVAGIVAGILLFVWIRRVLRRSASDATATPDLPPT